MTDRVLLTGISGFLGGHVALALLNAGFKVRGSVRDLNKAKKVRKTLSRVGADDARLEFVSLDLLEDAGWNEAALDCRYVVHTASPFFIAMPPDRNDLIRPAVEGTRRAVGAALSAGVERIVLTSSIAAIVYGHAAPSRPFTGDDWSDIGQPDITAYVESKTSAERAAWDMVETAGRRECLAAINPGVILGPLLDDDPGTSGTIVQRIMTGGLPALPRIFVDVIDVRDVAAVHLAAMTTPEAGGRRFIVADRSMSFLQVANVLRAEFPDRASRIPKREIPDWLLRLARLVSGTARDSLAELGPAKTTDAGPARALLGKPFIPAEDAIVATARSLIANGLV